MERQGRGQGAVGGSGRLDLVDVGDGQHTGTRRPGDLPGAAIKYVRRIEELIQCPVALVSTSPERDDTILVITPDNPTAEAVQEKLLELLDRG